jgi:HKD family nuclease
MLLPPPEALPSHHRAASHDYTNARLTVEVEWKLHLKAASGLPRPVRASVPHGRRLSRAGRAALHANGMIMEDASASAVTIGSSEAAERAATLQQLQSASEQISELIAAA